MIFPRSSLFAGPMTPSAGGESGIHSSGRVARTSIGFGFEGSDESGGREWTAGARMNIALKGLDGEERQGMHMCASNDSSWSGVSGGRVVVGGFERL